MTVSALFVLRDSIYKDLGIDSWDEDRNALNWPGGNPIIAHPPCRLWSRLAPCAYYVPGEKELAIWSIEQARTWGGVVEHPKSSKLFDQCNLPLVDGFPDEYGGYTIYLDQFHFGHRAAKPTCLYICGLATLWDLPTIPKRADEPGRLLSGGSWQKEGEPSFKSEVTHRERSATPPAFADWLIETASKCRRPEKWTEKTRLSA